VFRKLAISFAAIAATVGFTSVAAPAHADVNISEGVYQFSNYGQYLTNPFGVAGVAGDKITFTNGPDSGQASTWLLIPHGRVTASGDTFTPGSGLNAAFNNYTIWELQNGYGLDAGGCLGDDNWQYACLNEIPNNYFVIGSLGGNNYYLVNVHASNISYMNSGVTDTPWLLASMGSGAQAQYQPWASMGSMRPEGSTLTAHEVSPS
jgi:hypothetical protein